MASRWNYCVLIWTRIKLHSRFLPATTEPLRHAGLGLEAAKALVFGMRGHEDETTNEDVYWATQEKKNQVSIALLNSIDTAFMVTE